MIFGSGTAARPGCQNARARSANPTSRVTVRSSPDNKYPQLKGGPEASMEASTSSPSPSTSGRPAGMKVPPMARRSAVMMGISIALTQPLRGIDGAIASGGRMVGPSSSVFELDSDDFYANWPYARPTDLLPYVFKMARRGDPSSVLRAIDAFSMPSGGYPMYNIGPEKGAMLESLARQVKPQLIIELGTFDAVDTAAEILKFAGLMNNSDRQVIIEYGLSSEVLPDLSSRVKGPAQLVFEDHCKPCYLPDLLTLEKTKLIDEGTLVVADNVVYPGAPDYLAYLRDPVNGYSTALVPARYEYDQKWNPNWESKADAISVAVRGRPEVDGGYDDVTDLLQLFEYDQKWNPNWESKADAISVAVRGRLEVDGGYDDLYEYDQKRNPNRESKADAILIAVRGRPGVNGASDDVPGSFDVVPAQGSNPASFGSVPPEELREASSVLQDLCRGLPNGKRCAPIPASYSRG
eukprot:gene23063-30252_t